MSGGGADGRAGLAALLDAYGRLHDAELVELRADPDVAAVTLFLKEVRDYGRTPDQPLLDEVELRFSGAGIAWSGGGDVARAEGQGVIEATLTHEGLDLVLSRFGERLRITFEEVAIRAAPEGTWLREPPLTVHGTVVSYHGNGLLIRGASGSGKSALALELMAWGCHLVADDRVHLRTERGALHARCPRPLQGLIEARGIGLLQAGSLVGTMVTLVLDLDQEETERLPPWREDTILGVRVPVLRRPLNGPLAAAILQYLKGGRAAPAPDG